MSSSTLSWRAGFLIRARGGFHTQLEEASEVFDVARCIQEQSNALSIVRIFLLTDGVAKLPRGATLEAEPVGELELRPVLWDIAKLHQFHESGRQRDAGQIDDVFPPLRDERDFERIVAPEGDGEFVFVEEQRERRAPAACADDADVCEAHDWGFGVPKRFSVPATSR